jgi:hypothetical protein
VWIATAMMWSLYQGGRPVSHDHTVHYFEAWQLHHDMLAHGKLFGFSQRWFAGYPVSYLYPPGAALWVNAVYALAFGALSFSQAYAAAFWLFHVFTGLAVYRFGRLVGGPVVGLLAAVVCLTDLSDFRMGGWAYTAEYGVWPQALSLDFGLMALCSLPAIAKAAPPRSAGAVSLEGRGVSALAAFGLWMGLAIVTHPIQLVVLGILLLAFALAAAFADGVRGATALFRLLVAYGLALLVAAVWLVPFLSTRDETKAMGLWWDSTYEMGKGLLALDALPGTLGYVLAFGVLALVVMLRTREFVLLLTALMALCIPALSNATFIDELHLPMLSAVFTKLQFVRLSSMVKPFWFVLAAYFAVAAFAHGRKLIDGGAHGPTSYARSALLAATVGLLTLPVLVPMGQAYWLSHVRKTLVTESDRPFVRDRAALQAWLVQHLPKDGFYRVGVFSGQDHDLLDLGTVIDRPIYKRGFTPASNFIYQMQGRDQATLDAVNLRFAISKLALPSEQFEEIERFGPFIVYRYRRWQPQPFKVIRGQGEIALQRFGDEEIVLRAARGSSGTLRLNVSYFSRWRAYRDGVRVPITLTYLRADPEQTGFITVPLAPGTYRFAFEPTLGDRAAPWLGALGVLVCALLIFAERRGRAGALLRPLGRIEGVLDRWSEPHRSRLRLALLWASAGGALALALGLALWRPPLVVRGRSVLDDRTGALRRDIRAVRYDFLENLGRASANIEYHDSNQPCLRQGDRFVCRTSQGELDNERYVASSPASIEEYTMVRCIRARPQNDSLLSITFPDVPVGSAIVGYYGIERAGRLMNKQRPVDLQVMLENHVVYSGSTEADNKMHWFQIPMAGVRSRRTHVVFSVSADNVYKRYFCFYAQMVDL